MPAKRRSLVGPGVLIAIAALGCSSDAQAQAAPDRHRFSPSNSEMAWIIGGTFSMGCIAGDSDCYGDERPPVSAPSQLGFWLDTTEVTVGQYRRYVQANGGRMPASPSFGLNDNDPVVNVNWDEASGYCLWAEKRLPTELEWEVAARAGQGGAKFPSGDGIDQDHANFVGTGGRDRWAYVSPVGTFPANAFGLFDMAGNVWEWCADWYDSQPRVVGIDGATSGTVRVLKGGAWNSPVKSLRVSNRGRFAPGARQEFIGFRCARSARAEEAVSPGSLAPAAAKNEVSPQPSQVPTQTQPPSQPMSPTAGHTAGTSNPPPPPVAPAVLPAVATAGPPTAARPAADAVPPVPIAAPEVRKRQFPPAGIDMVWLPPGEFEMGCVRGDSECSGDEQPRHRVAFSQGFWIGATEVTLAHYRAFSQASAHPVPRQPEWVEDSHPVVNVDWNDATAYCTWAGGRLPTEAEWEYGARAGTAGGKFPNGRSITHEEANFDGIGGRDQWPKSSPVASFPPNAFGLFDMLGNAREWCFDGYDDHYYFNSPANDPPGPANGNSRCARGGSWTSDPGRLRISYRDNMDPSLSTVSTGFRCVIPKLAP
jgi:formylglycine-generating enzyme